ncbi:hypothetical protein D922_02472 [Enterococcus faecalis 06-MB-DW-09]|jgi:hypothetical protein|nr:hypothetical protein D922_02472 [Enterococcus faecalis 06-MB-DW-09]
MDFSTLTVNELIAVISFFGGLLFGISRFYAMFTRLGNTLEKLEKAISKLEQSQIDYGQRLSTIEAQIKSLFKQVGG